MTDEVSSIQSSRSSSSVLSSATEELFRIWQSKCIKRSSNKDIAKNKDSLRKEAKSFFQSLISGTQVNVGGNKNIVLKTKASHEEALAVLIQQLGPAFAPQQPHAARICALETCVGALQGCSEEGGTATLSNNVVKLLGNFFVTYCRPLEEEPNVDEDYDEQVRDTAVSGLTVLLRIPAKADSSSNNNVVQDEIQLRLDLAKSGVENRCAAPELEERMEFDHGFDHVPAGGGFESGLSTLPRSRRSLCFDLLKASVDSVAMVLQQQIAAITNKEQVGSALDEQLVGFATFSSNCLHGESDPRCLMQLLQLFYTLCVNFQPLFTASQSSNFPLVDIFDAIAPYYPIQFTPPPNNIHGVTREGLHQALMAVMCYTGYDAAAFQANKETMLSMSAGIILERLQPLPGDQPTTMAEKLEALQDLSMLLFSSSSSSSSSSDSTTTTSRFDTINVLLLRNMSDALIAVHEEASIAALKDDGNEEKRAKAAAELCRSIVARTALECERAKDDGSLWEAFVAEPLSALSSKLVSSPSQGRVAIAYMACLCSSGGPRTLRRGLAMGLPPLLDKVSSTSMQDDDDVATAAYGIGAFCSACTTAMEKAEKDGIVIHPHPMEAYGVTAVQKLHALLKPDSMDVDGMSLDVALPIRIAAVRAMESVLVASPASLFNSEQVEKMFQFVHLISDPLLLSNLSEYDSGSREEMEWLRACTQTLGGFLGRALDVSEGKRTESVLECAPLRTFMEETIFPAVVSSSEAAAENELTPRYDWKALAIACSIDLTTASRVVGSLVGSLQNSLLWNLFDASKSCAEALSFIFRHSDGVASKAYHGLAAPSVTGFDVIETLSSRGADLQKGSLEAGIGTSLLKLPPTTDELEKVDHIVEKSYDIVRLLLVAYETGLPSAQLDRLVTTASHVLPPLTEADVVKLSVALPFLSASLESSTPEKPISPSGIEVKLESMLPDLAEFTLVGDYNSNARSYASSCIYTSICTFIPRESKSCPSEVLIKNFVMPSLKLAVETKASSQSKKPSTPSIVDCLSLLAVLGSAAACRGGISSRTADQIVIFFIDLACAKKASLSFGQEPESQLDLSISEGTDQMTPEDLSVSAASFFGSILSVECDNLLSKQRLTHISMKRIQYHLENTTVSQGSRLGLLAAACHLICASNLRIVSTSSLQMFARVVAQGLARDALPTGVDENNLRSVRKLILAALMKLLSSNPSALSSNVSYLATGIMRVYATTGAPDPTADIPLKLLALQALQLLAEVDRNSLSPVKPAVVSILAAAMNHPSSLIRQAGVEVRNAWQVVGNT